MHSGSAAERRQTWTDDQLRGAIETERCWRGVQRKLDLDPVSHRVRKSLQKRAAQLGLDTSHFIGARRWTDRQLIGASSKASSWKELCELLGVRDYTNMRAHIRGHATRLGLSLAHLATPGPKPAGGVPAFISRAYAPEHLRSAAPSIAMAWFVLRGCTPSLPVEPQRYDLVVETPAGFKRVQVKSTTCFTNNSWQVSVSHRPDKNARREPYSPDDVDLFFIVDGELNLYVIPIEAVGGRINISLRSYLAFRVGNAHGLLHPATP